MTMSAKRAKPHTSRNGESAGLERKRMVGNNTQDEDLAAADIAGKADSAPVESESKPAASGLEAEMEDVKDRLLRALAEQENIRMRARRDVEAAHKFASSNFARDLLNTADNLQRALESIPQDKADETMKRLLAGVRATQRALNDTFEKHGIRRFDVQGENFDPERHEVVLQTPDPEHEPGTILEVLQPGYFYNDRLLRPARVNIAKEVAPVES
jgi:molecular chaperone GrpE